MRKGGVSRAAGLFLPTSLQPLQDHPLALNDGAISLPSGGGQLITMSSKGSNFLQSLHSAGSNQRNRTAASLKPCCFLGRGRWGSEVLGALEPQGRSTGLPGSKVKSKNPGWVSGLLVTQSKIVLHFISKEVLLSLKGGALLSSRLAVKKSWGRLALVGAMPQGGLA